jgi:hypothetical protein
MCAHGGNAALGLRPNDCEVALGSRGSLFGSYQVHGRTQHDPAGDTALALAVLRHLPRPLTSSPDARQVVASAAMPCGHAAPAWEPGSFVWYALRDAHLNKTEVPDSNKFSDLQGNPSEHP